MAKLRQTNYHNSRKSNDAQHKDDALKNKHNLEKAYIFYKMILAERKKSQDEKVQEI
jgi:hypothetical protein